MRKRTSQRSGASRWAVLAGVAVGSLLVGCGSPAQPPAELPPISGGSTTLVPSTSSTTTSTTVAPTSTLPDATYPPMVPVTTISVVPTTTTVAPTTTTSTSTTTTTSTSSTVAPTTTTTSTTTTVAPTTTTVAPTTTTTTTVAPTTSTTSTVAPTTSTTSTVAPTTSTTTTTTSTTLPPLPADCPAVVAPSPAAASLVRVSADWNGDGAADSGLSWAEPYAGGWCWYVGMAVVGGEPSAIGLGDLGDGFTKVVAPYDIDGSIGVDPSLLRPELFAIVDTIGGGWNVGVFGLGGDGRIVQFRTPDGRPFVFPVVVTATSRSGLSFDAGAGNRWMQLLAATTADGGATWMTYLTLADVVAPFTIDTHDSAAGPLLWGGDPALAAYGRISDLDTVLLDAEAGTTRP